MDLKSYLRGLGIGILVTTILFVVTFKIAGPKISNQEIIDRAKELGMIEATAFFSGTEAKEQENTQELPENTTEQNTLQTTNEATQETNISKEAELITESVTEAETEWSTITREIITVDLMGFQAAHQAAAMLQTAGVIEDAQSFTDFLIEEDYATRLLPGTYSFEMGMSYEQVAKRICWMEEN